MAVKVYRGDTWERSWLLQDAAGAVVPLDGATARLQVRGMVLETSASTEDGRIVIQAADGRIDMIIPFEFMDISPGTYNFDLELTHADNSRRTYEQGILVILEDFTHG